jgi:hypothetical protein
VNDPKFAWVAKKADTNVATVIAVWAALLEHASQEHERGNITGFDPESYDITLGLAEGTCQRVIDALRGKGILEIDHIAMWEARQPKNDDNSTDRVRRLRERRKAECNADETACNGDETACNTDKSREDKKKNMGGEPPEWALIRSEYPRRDGDNRWPKALTHARARLREGHTWDEMLAGTRRYAAFVRAAGNEGTPYVKQAATFFGTDKAFLEAWKSSSSKTTEEIYKNAL